MVPSRVPYVGLCASAIRPGRQAHEHARKDENLHNSSPSTHTGPAHQRVAVKVLTVRGRQTIKRTKHTIKRTNARTHARLIEQASRGRQQHNDNHTTSTNASNERTLRRTNERTEGTNTKVEKLCTRGLLIQASLPNTTLPKALYVTYGTLPWRSKAHYKPFRLRH